MENKKLKLLKDDELEKLLIASSKIIKALEESGVDDVCENQDIYMLNAINNDLKNEQLRRRLKSGLH